MDKKEEKYSYIQEAVDVLKTLMISILANFGDAVIRILENWKNSCRGQLIIFYHQGYAANGEKVVNPDVVELFIHGLASAEKDVLINIAWGAVHLPSHYWAELYPVFEKIVKEDSLPEVRESIEALILFLEQEEKDL